MDHHIAPGYMYPELKKDTSMGRPYNSEATCEDLKGTQLQVVVEANKVWTIFYC